MLRVAGRRLSSLSWLSAQPSSAALASRNPFPLSDSSSNGRTASASSPADCINSFPSLIRADGKNKMKVISPCNYLPFNQIRCGTVEPHSTFETVRNIVRNVATQQGPPCFRGEGRRYFNSFRYNHSGLFAPFRAEQPAAHQLPGSAARRFYRRGEKPPSRTPDRNQNIRDHRRRLLAAKYELRRNLYKALCRDPDLPNAMRVKHRCKLSKLPRNSSFTRVTNRCIFSGRSRAVYKKFRISRIVFRTLANQGQLMGIKKASW